MILKIFKAIREHKIISAVIVVSIIGGGYIGLNKIFSKENITRYATTKVEKGTLVVSVSGTGQVKVKEQVDIKSKVAGEIKEFYLVKDQEVKAGALLAQLDTKDAKQAITDAEIALESVKLKLEDLLTPPDAQDLLQAENALAQAERDFEKTKTNYESITAEAEKTLTDAYKDGYSNVSTIFFKLADYMKDLKDVLGTDKNSREYVAAYEGILGKDSLFIRKLLADYDTASGLYGANFVFFRQVFQNDSRDTIYKLISDTLKTTEAITQALESARHMYDAITTINYSQYVVAATIDKMQPKIESDLSAIFSNSSSLQNIIDTIDNTVEDTPGKIKDAELAFKSAQEKLNEKKLALEEMKAGADELDIKTQQNLVAQKEAALLKTKENLAEHSIFVPFDGIIAETNVEKGDAISANTAFATIITKQRFVELTLNEVDIAKVKVDQKAALAFDALPDLALTGKVIEMDTLGTVSQGVVTYTVQVAFDIEDDRIKPSMTVSVDIIGEVKPDVLLAPNSAVKQQAETSYVETPAELDLSAATASPSGAIFKEQPRRQTVEVGSANDEFTEIVNGLQEGDLVITRTIQPNSSQGQQTQQSSSFRIPGITGGGLR